MAETGAKPVDFIGSTKKVLRGFPDEVKESIGHGIWVAQTGERVDYAKPLKGFGGAGVLELIVDHSNGNTYRGVYTVNFPKAIYVLHAFIKKSKKGIQTPRQEIDLIKKRLAEATKCYKATYGDK